jgi:hypothetical protein
MMTDAEAMAAARRLVALLGPVTLEAVGRGQLPKVCAGCRQLVLGFDEERKQ